MEHLQLFVTPVSHAKVYSVRFTPSEVKNFEIPEVARLFHCVTALRTVCLFKAMRTLPFRRTMLYDCTSTTWENHTLWWLSPLKVVSFFLKVNTCDWLPVIPNHWSLRMSSPILCGALKARIGSKSSLFWKKSVYYPPVYEYNTYMFPLSKNSATFFMWEEVRKSHNIYKFQTKKTHRKLLQLLVFGQSLMPYTAAWTPWPLVTRR